MGHRRHATVFVAWLTVIFAPGANCENVFSVTYVGNQQLSVGAQLLYLIEFSGPVTIMDSSGEILGTNTYNPAIGPKIKIETGGVDREYSFNQISAERILTDGVRYAKSTCVRDCPCYIQFAKL